jgi:hypothetical protein
MNALTVIEQPALPVELTATLELAADFARASKAKATQEAYGSDWRIFESWCRPRGLSALPASAESLCAFLADEAYPPMMLAPPQERPTVTTVPLEGWRGASIATVRRCDGWPAGPALSPYRSGRTCMTNRPSSSPPQPPAGHTANV